LYGKNNKPNTKLIKEFGDTIELALQNKGPICKARDEYLSNMEVRQTGRFYQAQKRLEKQESKEKLKSK
jgi:hypothetical protein